MNRTRSAVLVGAAVLTLVVPTASQAAQPIAAETGDHYTPLVGTLLSEPHPVDAADGRVHLDYEFLLLNPLPQPITVTRLEVLDAGRQNRVLDDLRGPSLETVLSSFVGTGTAVIGGGETRRVILDVSLPAGPRPQSLIHRITVADVPLPVLANPFRTAPTTVSEQRAIVVAAPLRGPRWIDVAGCCAPAGHRISVEPINGALHVGQRFAVDITRMWPDGRLFHGPPDQVTSFAAYGQPVLAAATGVVVASQDGQPDQVPFDPTPPGEPKTILGNGVVVDIGHGRFAAYAHLKPGSVAVAVGDRVREGQRLGLVGNTGNSDLPHLHFQVMDTSSPLGSSGLPFVFRSFESPGSIPPIDQIDASQPIPVRPILAGHFDRVIPMDLQVLNFPIR
jgi:hypothetical protein